MKRKVGIMTAGLLLLALGGCGYRAGLERPPPMWGEARAQYEREQAAREVAEDAQGQEDAEPAAPSE